MKTSTIEHLKAIAFAIVLAAAMAVVSLVTKSAQDEHEAWAHLRDANRCQVVRQESPPAGIGTVPSKTVWLCDFGETYVRDTE